MPAPAIGTIACSDNLASRGPQRSHWNRIEYGGLNIKNATDALRALGRGLLATLFALASLNVSAADLAIVLDDVGYSKDRSERAINLPGRLTIAVLPFAPHTQMLLPAIEAAGHDVIIHQPMEPQPSPSVRVEHDTLRLNMSNDEFDSIVERALSQVPQSKGLSNHTGSLLTAHRDPMQRVMRKLSDRSMYFLDSRTTAETVALDVAIQMGVPAVRRDVFLDHNPASHAIEAAFERAIQVARRKGHAVVVGHPYPSTLAFLESKLRALPGDIKLVTASSIAQRQHEQRRTLSVTRTSKPLVLPAAFSLSGQMPVQ